MAEALDVLIVGAGMYVAGRGTDGFGTILPALLEGRRQGLVGRLAVAATSAASAADAQARCAALAGRMGVDGGCLAWPGTGSSDTAYLDALQDFGPDAAVVCVPDHLHAAVTLPLLKAGVHCLVVKPLAPTLAEATEMADAADEAGVVAQVEFHKRLDESNLLMRDAVRSGRLGELLYATVEYSQQKRVPRDIFRAWAHRTNVFQYLGVHYVDLLQWATGYTPVSVSAWAQGEYLRGQGVDTPDSMQVVILWHKGDGRSFVSTHVTNWIDPDESSAMSDQRINVVGTQGRYQADQKRRGVQLVEDGRGQSDVNPYFSNCWSMDSGLLCFRGYGIASILSFASCCLARRDGTPTQVGHGSSLPSFRQALIACAVVEAAGESLHQGGSPVNVDQQRRGR